MVDISSTPPALVQTVPVSFVYGCLQLIGADTKTQQEK